MNGKMKRRGPEDKEQMRGRMRPLLGRALIPSLGAPCGTVLNMILPVNTHPRRVTGDRYMVRGINRPSHFE